MLVEHAGASRRILVVANETVTSELLHEAIRSQVQHAQGTVFLIVAPALNSRLRHWLSDDDEARRAALSRLEESLECLSEAGIDVEGFVGDADPLQAIEDALGFISADLVIIATHPEGHSNWLARDLVGRAADRFRVPIMHIVVDSDASREYVVGPGTPHVLAQGLAA
jgi:GABA permease